MQNVFLTESQFSFQQFAQGSWFLLVAVLCILLFMTRRKTKAEREAREAKRLLEINYGELEEAYQKLSDAQAKLEKQYDELKLSEEQSKKLAYSDFLTELPNRAAFSIHLEERMKEMESKGGFTLIYIDLDNFKTVNDGLGHSYGDELLVDVTGRFKEVLTKGDYLARFGGDEFMLLCNGITSREMIDVKVKKIQEKLEAPFVLSSKEFFVTSSMGVCIAPQDGNTPQMLIKNADAAMYMAKEQGKNACCYYTETINNTLMNLIVMQSELRHAIEREEFEVYYQAQIDLKEDRLVGFEALVRWNHPTRGLIGPGEFMGIAEETGLIVPIGRFVMFEACRQIAKWREEGFEDITVAVNLSGRQFRDADIVSLVKEVIETYQIEPKNLELEITETIALENLEYTIEIITALKEIGIKFALDDFGTGYSSMNYLKHLPVNNLKIDKSFVDTVLESKNDQTIVSTIIKLAQTLKLDVIAEGVENPEQVSFLKDARCNKAQGFLYSRPIPKDEAEELLKNFSVNRIAKK